MDNHWLLAEVGVGVKFTRNLKNLKNRSSYIFRGPVCSDSGEGRKRLAMACLCTMSVNTVLRLVSLAGLLFILAGHVATFGFAYHHRAAGQDQGEFGEQLLTGGLVLGSVLLLLAVSLLLPAQAASLQRVWLALHLTRNDDLARHAVLVMFDLQVRPLANAIGLGSLFADLDTLDYWWWSLQGLLLVVLARRVSGSSDEGRMEDEREEDHGLEEVVVGGEVMRQAIRTPAGPLWLPAYLGHALPAVAVEV